jgi:hypothetical protein
VLDAVGDGRNPALTNFSVPDSQGIIFIATSATAVPIMAIKERTASATSRLFHFMMIAPVRHADIRDNQMVV